MLLTIIVLKLPKRQCLLTLKVSLYRWKSCKYLTKFMFTCFYYFVLSHNLDIKSELGKDLKYCSDLFVPPAATANTFYEVYSDTEEEAESERFSTNSEWCSWGVWNTYAADFDIGIVAMTRKTFRKEFTVSSAKPKRGVELASSRCCARRR